MNTRNLNDYHVGIAQVIDVSGAGQGNGAPADSVTYTVALFNRDGSATTVSGVRPMYRMVTQNPSPPDVDIYPAPVGSLWPAIFGNDTAYVFIQEREAVGDCTGDGSGGAAMAVLLAIQQMGENELRFIRSKLLEASDDRPAEVSTR